jgi:NADPH:quinone reductase
VLAVRCVAPGSEEPIRVEEIAEPAPGPGEVLVEVHASGVNFPDILLLQGRYQRQPEVPFTPGGELAGVVVALGPGVDQPNVDDRVFTSGRYGAWAERACVPAAMLLPVPVGRSMTAAAAFPITYNTSYYALKDRARLRAGETLLVLGAAGGVGLAAVELGHAMGARVIAVASTAEKRAACAAHGADVTLEADPARLRAAVREATDGAGVDVVYDPVGGDLSELALRSLAWDGRFLVIGFASGEIPAIPLNLPLLKGASVIGVFWGAWAERNAKAAMSNRRELNDLWAGGALNPAVFRTYPFTEAASALAELEARRAIGKVVLTMPAAGGS